MKVEFQDNYKSPAFEAKRGDVIESDSRPPDQLQRWLNRGLVKAVANGNGKASQKDDPKRQATTGGNRRKATT